MPVIFVCLDKTDEEKQFSIWKEVGKEDDSLFDAGTLKDECRSKTSSRH